MSTILQKIQKLPFLDDQYYKEETIKTQIVLHHTVSADNAYNVAKYWESTPDHVGTSMIITKDGTPHQIFSSMYWAYHLGLKKETFDKYGVKHSNLDKTSIGIEICNWGGLTFKNGKFYTYFGNEIPKENVLELGYKYRGFQFFEKYTKEQIETVRELLLYWNTRYSIPLDYSDSIWDVSKKALSGESGIFSHTSYREDKSDCFPQIELIEMLKNLKQ